MVEIADDLTTDRPGVVEVASDRLARETRVPQVQDEWPQMRRECPECRGQMKLVISSRKTRADATNQKNCALDYDAKRPCTLQSAQPTEPSSFVNGESHH